MLAPSTVPPLMSADATVNLSKVAFANVAVAEEESKPTDETVVCSGSVEGIFYSIF